MIDFRESFKIGIAAAEQAEKNIAEIKGVFDELNAQLVEIAQGKLRVELAELYESVNPFLLSAFEKKPTYTAIVAKNPKAKDGSLKELAKWKQDKSGYPCTISFYGNELYCEDKEGLEESLSYLLRDPEVGEAMHCLMNRPLAGDFEF